MTLVVTHTGGFLGCFTVNPDGTMRQRALIDTGNDQVAPQELAETGMVLAETYGWQLNGVLPAPAPKPVKAVPAEPKKKALPPSRSNWVTRSYPPKQQKESMVLGYLKQHPDSTIKEVLSGLNQPTDIASVSNWQHTFTALMKVLRISRDGTRPSRYFLTE